MSEARGSSVVVDPRMRSRRIEVQRDAGRRRLRRVLAVAGAVSGLLAAYAVTQSPALDVDHVRVAGGEHTAPDAVALASGVGRGEPMFGLDTGMVARRVEALPWVRNARVERRWPGTVSIRITERTPAAVVPVGESEGEAARLALVDGTGRVLSDRSGPEAGSGDPSVVVPPGLPRLSGVRGDVTAGESLRGDARDAVLIVAALAEALPGAVSEVSTDLEATLVSGGRVRFGNTEDLDDKMVAVETVLADVDVAGLAVLDVRVPGNPVLTRDERSP